MNYFAVGVSGRSSCRLIRTWPNVLGRRHARAAAACIVPITREHREAALAIYPRITRRGCVVEALDQRERHLTRSFYTVQVVRKILETPRFGQGYRPCDWLYLIGSDRRVRPCAVSCSAEHRAIGTLVPRSPYRVCGNGTLIPWAEP